MSAKSETLARIESATVRIMLSKARSAWARGVNNYAVDLLDDLKEAVAGEWVKPETLKDWKGLRAALLNGADDWSAYSWGGSALIYDGDIAKALCNPTEYKRTRGRGTSPECPRRMVRRAGSCIASSLRRRCA